MSILVTGGAGYIGSHTCVELLDAGYDIVAVSYTHLLIKEAGGLAFAAHLHHNKMEDDELVPFLKRLKEVGLDGVEGYYTEYTPEMQEKYQRMARELSLAVSGGTDFHGAMKPHIQIGTGMGNLRIPYSVLEQIKNK